MGSAATILDSAPVVDTELEELLSATASMEEVEGLVKVPQTDEETGDTGLDGEDDLLSATACEQILDKLMLANGNNNNNNSNGSHLSSLGWEESFNELFPDLA